jgi:DNA helicase HerA-like ATPase
VSRAFDELEAIDLLNESSSPDELRPRPFLTLEYLRKWLRDETKTADDAMMARLNRIQALNLFAETQSDGNTFQDRYDLCAQKGGALIVDLAHLNSRFAREAFVGATLDMVERVAKERIASSSRKLPFVFFEEAHLYTASERIENLVTRARHLGVTTTFITNMVTQLNEAVLRQVDNLFLMYLPHSDDVRYVSKSASTDAGTVEAFAQRIEKHHAMIVGTASGSYPLVFKVAALDTDVDVGGKTKLAFAD